MARFSFRYVDLLVDPYGFQHFEPIGQALYFGTERFPQCKSWRADIARYLAFADKFIAQAIARDDSILADYPREYQECRVFLRASRNARPEISSDLARLALGPEHDPRLRGNYLLAAIALRQCERCIAAAKAGDVLAVGFLVNDLAAMLHNEDWEWEKAVAAHEAGNRARIGAKASHVKHHDNRRAARAWYAAHKPMHKDDAAQRIKDAGVVHASWRTIRDYLIGQ